VKENGGFGRRINRRKPLQVERLQVKLLRLLRSLTTITKKNLLPCE
jgi:hypothetical protein